MSTVQAIAEFLQRLAPPNLAADWDNVGLLVGDSSCPVQRVMTCLTITPDAAREAIEAKTNLIVTHHPLPFRPLRQLTTATAEGRILLELISAGVAIYSPHTAFDSARQGINQRLAEGLGLRDIKPLLDAVAGSGTPEDVGTGRWGSLDGPCPLQQIAERLKSFLRVDKIQLVGDSGRAIQKVAVACGSGGEMLDAACQLGCDCFVTGETRFHTCLEAEARGVSLLLAGHYASERFAVERLAEVLAQQFSTVTVWASRRERDPLQWA